VVWNPCRGGTEEWALPCLDQTKVVAWKEKETRKKIVGGERSGGRGQFGLGDSLKPMCYDLVLYALDLALRGAR